MSSNPENQSQARRRQFPQRVLIANVAHPDREEVQLELLPDAGDWGDLTIASYVLEDSTDE
jgi:hypothetical protein